VDNRWINYGCLLSEDDREMSKVTHVWAEFQE
jgi:hypothetical protein